LTATLVGLSEIQAAADRIRGIAARTPLVSVSGDRRGGPSGPPLSLKCENEQPMGAFKMRGAVNFLAQLSPEARAAGVITYSSGNHGQAVALAAQRLGLRCVVVMPETAPRVKVEGVHSYGGEVTAVYVPVGGGGQLAGIAAAVKALKPAIRMVGVEPAGAARMTASRAAGRRVRLEKTASIADGLLTLEPGTLTFAHMQALVDDIVTVEDAGIADAVRWLFTEARIVAEPSGASSVAAVLKAGPSISPGTVAVISGGNVSPEDHDRYVNH
jgi:threonine dehydratase